MITQLYPGWENIKDSLIAYLAKTMEMRLADERLEKRKVRIDVLGKIVSAFRRSSMTPRDFFPTLGTIANVPHISGVLGCGDEEAFEELKNGIVEQLPGLTAQIRKDREETLLKLLPPGYISPEPLKLATTWFSNGLVSKAARAEDVLNEMWNSVRREVWDKASVNEGILWSVVAPHIVFENKVMAAVAKLITDLGIGDPEKMTAEELDNVHCRVVIFCKDPKKPVLNMEVGGWRSLVREISSHSPRTSKISLLRNRYRRSRMVISKSPTGVPSKTTNSQMSRPSVSIPSTSCGIACIVGGRGMIKISKNLLRHENIYWMREF